MHVAILQTLPAYDEDVKVVQPTPQESVRTNCREAEKQRESATHVKQEGSEGYMFCRVVACSPEHKVKRDTLGRTRRGSPCEHGYACSSQNIAMLHSTLDLTQVHTGMLHESMGSRFLDR